ncbi:MAG: 4Fe-4S dicluster domain-containing protein [Candidatus Schekmanbacteria bacterium]|nr:4Fe-4S dicluster domain-containing protein [Candidatus Schekmanbacteria bacterium]
MGHLGHLKEEYDALLGRLNAGPVGLPEPTDQRALEGWREILEIFYRPEEAALAARMPMRPESLEKIAARVGEPAATLKVRLDAMCEKGLVMDLVHPETGRVKYLLAPPVVGFFEFSMMRAHDMFPKKRVAEALDAYAHGDPAFAREVFAHETVIGRAMVREEHVLGELLPDVLDWERATALIENARTICVSLCYCRHEAEHLGRRCDVAVETCLSLNGGADFVSRRNFGRGIERSEAMDILARAKDDGLVQIADNVRNQPAYICNCCGCCCGQLRAINDYDLPAVNPSGFQPRHQPENCKGCSRCARACPIAAIAMVPERAGSRRKNELRPRIDLDRCIGCGVCTAACRKDALQMVRRERQPHVPRNAVERSVRQALEKGRLAHLLFDEGSSRGSAFLNHVVRALTALPGAERLLAQEQVRSRFVDFALRTVRDPTGG